MVVIPSETGKRTLSSNPAHLAPPFSVSFPKSSRELASQIRLGVESEWRMEWAELKKMFFT